jgi:hypothetical protein
LGKQKKEGRVRSAERIDISRAEPGVFKRNSLLCSAANIQAQKDRNKKSSPQAAFW